jgi:thioredoxin-like negative regulator of GroEL
MADRVPNRVLGSGPAGLDFAPRGAILGLMADSEKPYLELESEDDVDSVMAEDGGAVVLDFWSPSCGPCMAMADDFSHVADQFDPGEVRFCKVNTGTHGWLAAPFNIRSVPTILFVSNGRILDAVVGRMTAAQLGERSEWLVKKNSKKGLFSRLRGR